MDFLSIAKARYSCRSYLKRQIEPEKMQRVLEAGRIAPSAVNYQPWHFIVFSKPEGIQMLHLSYPRDWFKEIPYAIVICGDHTVSWKRKDHKDYCDIDIAITTDHMSLQAASEGLATCWVCNFDARLLSEKLNLPSHIEPIVIMPLGYPADQSDMDRYNTKRKKSSDIIHYEKF